MRKTRQKHDAVTIQDVATVAGVSAMTVSNVINRKGKVGDATRARIMTIIDKLGYVPSQAARHLVGAAAARIGVLYADVESMFLNTALTSISTASAQRGLQLLLGKAADMTPAGAETAAAGLVRSGADGLLLIPPFAELLDSRPSFQALNVPAAAITTAGPLTNMATVRIDNFLATRTLTELLIARGRRRIAMIAGPARHSDSVAREEGYKAALRTHGMDIDPNYRVEARFTFATGLDAAHQLLSLRPRPDAIVAANDDMAAAVLWAAHSQGLSVPGDLAVTGFDDTLVATRVWPALTTIRQPIPEMAASALDMLIEAVKAPPEQRRHRDQILDFTLVERGSVPVSMNSGLPAF